MDKRGRKSTCNVLFWNVHGQVTKSIGNKFADIEFLNVCKGFEILGLAELHTLSKPNINGFKLIKDKIRQKLHKGPKISGGLAVFAKKEIAHMIQHIPNNHEDSIWVKISKEVSGELKDIYLGTCYISPPKKGIKKGNDNRSEDKHGSVEKFFEEAEKFSKKGEVILQGDINARIGNQPDFLVKDKYDEVFGIINNENNPPRTSEDKKVCDRGSLLLDLCKSMDFRVVNGRMLGDIFGKSTSFQWNGSAVVDYVLTKASNFTRVVEFKVGKSLPCLSDHCPLQYKLKLNIIKSKIEETPVEMKQLPPRCKWNNASKTSFIDALKSEATQQIFGNRLQDRNLTPEAAISELSKHLLEIANNQCDTTTKDHSKVNPRISDNKPWFDKECRETKRKINTLANRLKREPSDVKCRESLFTTKKLFKSMTKKKKMLYKQSIVDKMHLTKPNDVKQFWKLLNKLDLESVTSRKSHAEISPREWMNHYTTLLQNTNSGKIPENRAETGPLDYEVTIEELKEAKGILKPGKATGVDVISNEMILEALNMYPKAFQNVMNTLLKQGQGVTSWLTSLLVPIHKKGSTDDPDNYRGIALISCLAKLFYSILNNRLLVHCLKHNILSPSQLGFMAGNRTSDAHIILYNLINDYCHKRNSRIYGCFVDFSKAFDSIPRDRMFNKLLEIGVTGKFYDIIKYIYEGDQVCIKLNDLITPAIKTMMGVRQGCVLSPLLFNIYMSDFPKSLSQDVGVGITDELRINCILWADDIILLSESEEGLNKLLENLKNYSELNHLKVNTDKTKCMIFNKTGRLIRRNFYLGNTKLENVRGYKYLGLIITPSGEVRTALDDLRSRALKAYMALKNKLGYGFRDHIDDTISLFDSLVKPILLYGSDFWGCLKLPKNNPIENLHMQFCRQVLGVQKSTTKNGVLLELGRVPLVLEAQRLALKNWGRIKNEEGNILVTKSHENASQNNLKWTQTINEVLSKHGMSFRINEISQNIGNAFFGRAKDMFHQEAFCGINAPQAKLRTYGLIKHDIGRENYLIQIRNIKVRQKLTKLRLSNHKLRIEVGRHMGLQKEERVCEVCNEDIEDEIHFLVKCKHYEPLRRSLLETCMQLKPNFMFYSDEEKFIYLMTNHSLLGNVSKFIDSAYEERDIFLDVKFTLNSILDKIL